MKANIYRRTGVLDAGRGQFYITLSQGVQSFRLEYGGSLSECEWMAKMFRKALRSHNAELKKRWAR